MDDVETELARTADREPVVRAWVARHPDTDLLKAHRAAGSESQGPLVGWSFGVKDVIDTADLPTERGSPIYAGRHTRHDAACVALVRRAGAVITGKTTTTEFALITPAATTNPHNVEHTPGGSSSGSAAAVADGMARAAFGTQTVGSVLRPASFCGIVGFKPSHQLVPVAGVASLAPSFDTVGWFTRSVGDSQAVFRAVTDAPVVVESPDEARAHAEGRGRTRIGYYRSHQWHRAQPELATVLDDAAGRLADYGVEVVDIEPLEHLDGLFEAGNVVFQYEIARVLSWEREQHGDQISPLAQRMLDSCDRVELGDYARAQRQLDLSRRAHDDYLAANAIDALLTPTAPGEAPPVKTTGDSVFNRTWTSLGVPAMTLPAATGPLDLPIGLTLAGARWGDRELLATAADVEHVVGAGL